MTVTLIKNPPKNNSASIKKNWLQTKSRRKLPNRNKGNKYNLLFYSSKKYHTKLSKTTKAKNQNMAHQRVVPQAF
jgi:hypothetical protein